MNFKRMKQLAAVLLCVALFITSGCGQKPVGTSDASDTVAQAAFPVTVTDAAGREVTIETEPQTIVSGYYITSSLLIALGLADKVVGMEAKADLRPIYALAAPEMLKLPNVGTAKNFDLEGCAALKPDLVVLPTKLKDSAASLEQLGIKTLLVNPESTEQLRDVITLVGQATGTTQRANRLLSFMEEKYAAVADTTGTKPRVYLGGNSALLSTAGAKMYQNAMIEAAGGENVASELTDSYWAEVSYEQLLSWNPDVIILASDATYSPADVLNDANLAQVTAVQNKAVYQLPSSIEAFDSPVPSSVLGVLWLAQVLRPDAYHDFEADAAAFYQEFYSLGVTPELLQ